MEILETKTDIGLVREQNEDVVLAVKHPKDETVKLLIAADGMGGREHGEIASRYVAFSLRKWFINKDLETLLDLDKSEQLLRRYIKSLNSNLIKDFGEDKLGTTLTLALVSKKETLVLNTGDSRAYIYKNKKFIQLTEDDSDVWMYYKFGNVKKDHLRYFTNNSIISACIGICPELCTISSVRVKNTYDILLLLTDGVTDNLTDRRMRTIIRQSSDQMILTNLIQEAVYVDQHLKVPLALKRKYTANYSVPYNGRDNASGVIYIRKRKQKKNNK